MLLFPLLSFSSVGLRALSFRGSKSYGLSALSELPNSIQLWLSDNPEKLYRRVDNGCAICTQSPDSGRVGYNYDGSYRDVKICRPYSHAKEPQKP